MKAVAVLVVLGLCLSLAAVEKPPLQEFRARRERLATKVPDGIVVAFAAADKELVEYQQEANFFYLTGFDEPDAVLLIDTSARPLHDYFFLKPRDLSEERWTGAKLGPGPEAVAKLGIQSVQPLSEFPAVLKRLSANKPVFALQQDFGRIRQVVPKAALQDLAPAVAALRQVKSAAEIALLEKAVEITMQGEEAAARAVAPNAMEYEVRAALEYEFRRNGAERPGFPSIVGSGPMSTVLHYDKSSRRMESGEVVVVDIGAEYGGYSADITRTYPVSGKFSPRQREIYQIVLDAQKAAIAEVRPGTTLDKVHAAAFDYIRLKGYAEFFIHATSHHIGLQVHDVGSLARPLEPNMVITVEPGIYIPEEKIGIRIEDDVLVTAGGARVLSTSPKEIGEVEREVGKRPLRY